MSRSHVYFFGGCQKCVTVKQKADFTCCWCKDRRNKVEIHHIVPQSQRGPDTEENAAPLCGSCHVLYGNNPDLRKEIRDRRDYWYERCATGSPTSQSDMIATSTLLQLSADLLDGGVYTIGDGRDQSRLLTLWQLWLELYLVPHERVPATIPFHQITGMLEISGLHSEGFDSPALQTTYNKPPATFDPSYGYSKGPKQIMITSPIPVLFAANCQTPKWEPSSTPHEDRIRLTLKVAETDYQTLEIVAPLLHLEYQGSTKWRLKQP